MPPTGRRSVAAPVGEHEVERRRREDHPATKHSYSAVAIAAEYSAGFQTTVLPHSSAGTRYQDGTATGKFPAVTTAITPTGMRKVNSALSCISDGTVSP